MTLRFQVPALNPPRPIFTVGGDSFRPSAEVAGVAALYESVYWTRNFLDHEDGYISLELLDGDERPAKAYKLQQGNSRICTGKALIKHTPRIHAVARLNKSARRSFEVFRHPKVPKS